MKTVVSRTLSVHNEHELLLKLETAGLSEKLAQKVISSKGNRFAARVVKFIQNDGFYPTTSQECARKIMGKNFFGIKEAIKHFGIDPMPQQLAVLSEIPFSEGVLEELKKTHVLTAVFPLSILEIRGKAGQKLFSSYNNTWYENEPFAKERGEVNWQLVRKTPVDNSTSNNFQKQYALLGKDDEVPTTRVMVYTIIGHYLVTGKHLFKDVYVRTSFIMGLGGLSVGVGNFASEGLSLKRDWDEYKYIYLGISSARKFLILKS